MEQTRSGDVDIAWDAEARMATMRHLTAGAVGRGQDAVVLVAAFDAWVRGDERPFALLGDAGNLVRVEREWLTCWSAFFRRYLARASIAIFDVAAPIRVAGDLFRLGTGVRFGMFATETEARSWLSTPR
jgi:hypothetical protein